jgi:sulfatase maturation enzyme AslB (radical SAM superfamily)
VRVFVGRLEIVTPATERAVERALATHDDATLEKYGRFLEPILQSMIKKESNPRRVRQIENSLSAYWSAEVAKNRVGE